MFRFRVGAMLISFVIHRSATSRQKCMDLSKQNVNIVFSHSVKWPISSSWITLACQYMYACRSSIFILSVGKMVISVDSLCVICCKDFAVSLSDHRERLCRMCTDIKSVLVALINVGNAACVGVPRSIGQNVRKLQCSESGYPHYNVSDALPFSSLLVSCIVVQTGRYDYNCVCRQCLAQWLRRSSGVL